MTNAGVLLAGAVPIRSPSCLVKLLAYLFLENPAIRLYDKLPSAARPSSYYRPAHQVLAHGEEARIARNIVKLSEVDADLNNRISDTDTYLGRMFSLGHLICY
jgi:hypothetical protein